MNTKSIAWQPSVLVKAADRWYIKFYTIDPDTQTRKKFKRTFNLNRINNLQERERRGLFLSALLNYWVDQGRSPFTFDEQEAKSMQLTRNSAQTNTTLNEAMDYILKLKERDLRSVSMKAYRSISGMFLEFCKRQGWDKVSVSYINRSHASAYMDHCIIDRGIGNYSYNNNLRHMRAIFEALRERGYIEENPFKEIKFKRTGPKIRRNFSLKEARIVMQEIRKTDPLLFLATLMQYCCQIRPTELRKLKFDNIDLDIGIIVVHPNQAKSGNGRIATIPDDFKKYFDRDFFEKYPGYYFIFGKGFHPHAEAPVGKGTMYRKHESILKKLKKEGELDDIKGLSWYSWKDTGITDMLDREDIPLLAVQDQAGHSSPDMTLKYRHSRGINRRVQSGFTNRLLDHNAQ